MTTKNIIVATGSNGEIGYKQNLPWKDYNDLSWFKKMTYNDYLLMGRKTWESIPYDKLDGRIVYVLSRECKESFDGKVRWVNCLCNVPKIERQIDSTLWVCGGESIYNYFVNTNKYDNIFLTRFYGSYKADCFFPLNYVYENTTRVAKWVPRNENFPDGTYREIRS